MKKSFYALIAIIPLTLTSCASQDPELLMSTTRYKKPISFHSNKKAYITWEYGTDSYADMEPNPDSSLIYAIATNIDKNNNPAKYHYGFGRAHKVVFVTSLRDVLEQNKTFASVDIITTPHKLSQNDVIITINFKRTSASATQGHLITLNTEVDIEDCNGHFTKTHLVTSTPDKGFTVTSFAEKQENVSAQLMEKVIRDIEKWQQQA